MSIQIYKTRVENSDEMMTCDPMGPGHQLETNNQAKYEAVRLVLHQEHYYLIVNSSAFWTNYQSKYEEHNSEARDWQTVTEKEERKDKNKLNTFIAP